MSTQYAWIYDVLAVALTAGLIFLGGKRGFLKTVILVAGYVAAFISAGIVSKNGATLIYDNFVKEKVTSAIQENVSEVDIVSEIQDYFVKNGINLKENELTELLKAVDIDGLAEQIEVYNRQNSVNTEKSFDEIRDVLNEISGSAMLEKYTGELPDWLDGFSDDFIELNNEEVLKFVQAMMTSDEAAAEYIEQTLVRENIVSVIRTILYLLVFAVVMAVFGIIANVSGAANKIPVAGKMNIFLGAVLGFVQAVGILLITSAALSIIISISGNELVGINSETIENSIIFRYIYAFTDKIFQ